jgi:fermentation-respiration switch protein FrsA (DUF1100 family)
MAHGFSAVKEMYLSNFAEEFQKAGFVVLVFDYRFLGESEGQPRQQVLPSEQIKDYRNAISWVSQLTEVDPNRIGIWGSSFSGGHVLQVAAIDRRVKAVVSQAPLVNGWRNAEHKMGKEKMQLFIEDLIAYRTSRYNGEDMQYMSVVDEHGKKAAIPSPEAFNWFTTAHQNVAPNWENRITLESMEEYLAYNPAGMIENISPTPLLMIVAENDTTTPSYLAKEAFAKARTPKQFILVPGGHFDVYHKPIFKQTSKAAVDWFKKYLLY